MHPSIRTTFLAIVLYCLYLPAATRALPVDALVPRADVVDLDPVDTDTAAAHDDTGAAQSDTQTSTSDSSTEYDDNWPVIPESGAYNGIVDGLDQQGLPYVKRCMDYIAGAIPEQKRSPVFFTGPQPDTDVMTEMIEERLGGNGWSYSQAFTKSWETSFKGGEYLEDPQYWLLINRASDAMARSNMEKDVYVSMDSEGGARTPWNGVQKYDDNMNEIGEPGIGQIFYQVELPVLMRNPNTQRIITFEKDASGNFQYTVQWDANWDKTNPGYKDRAHLPEIPLDDQTEGPENLAGPPPARYIH